MMTAMREALLAFCSLSGGFDDLCRMQPALPGVE